MYITAIQFRKCLEEDAMEVYVFTLYQGLRGKAIFEYEGSFWPKILGSIFFTIFRLLIYGKLKKIYAFYRLKDISLVVEISQNHAVRSSLSCSISGILF